MFYTTGIITMFLGAFGFWVSLVAQIVKNLPAMQKIWVQSLGWKDPLKKEIAIHSSILAGKIS